MPDIEKNGQNKPERNPNAPSGNFAEIDLVELLFKFLENIKIIIAAALIGVIIAAVYVNQFVTPLYQATCELYIVNTDVAINISDLQLGTNLASDYLEIFNIWEIHDMVRKELGTDSVHKYDFKVTNPSNTRILKLVTTSPDPVLAQKVSNLYAKVARNYIVEKMATAEPSVLSEARVPSAPISPNKPRTVFMGLLIGMALAMGVITLLFIMDDRLRTSDDITKYSGLPTLAIVPAASEGNNQREAKSARKKRKRE